MCMRVCVGVRELVIHIVAIFSVLYCRNYVYYLDSQLPVVQSISVLFRLRSS